MYPIFRMLKEIYKYRNAPDLPVDGVHVSQHICWPWDLDIWWELNNGRTLTLFDLNRIPLGNRMGLVGVIRREKWGLAIAGSSVRFRRRVRAFDRFEMRARLIGHDEKFFYIEQSMWRNGDCTSHVLHRAAVTRKGGMVPPVEVYAAMDVAEEDHPVLPDWARAWIAADAERPWPPEM
ncbi:MAG: thioeseterase [Rhodobacterales bacterium]|nr:MAG: thioeseterase [Rhodobacterales bacterium]